MLGDMLLRWSLWAFVVACLVGTLYLAGIRVEIYLSK
jgi:hypothetical protein